MPSETQKSTSHPVMIQSASHQASILGWRKHGELLGRPKSEFLGTLDTGLTVSFYWEFTFTISESTSKILKKLIRKSS